MHEDIQALSRRYPVAFSPTTCNEFDRFYDEWERELESIDYETLDVSARVDFHLLKRRISAGRLLGTRHRDLYAGLSDWLPFAPDLTRLVESRIGFERLEPRETGRILDCIAQSLDDCNEKLATAEADALNAANLKAFLEQAQEHLADWYKEAYGYDPELSWWIEKPYE